MGPPDRATGNTSPGTFPGVSSLCLLPDTWTLVSSGSDHTLRVWNLDSAELVHHLHPHTLPVHGVALQPGKRRLPVIASISDDRTVRLWQPTNGRMVRFIRLASKPLDVAWLTDGSRTVAVCQDGRVRLIDPDRAKVTQNIPTLTGWAFAPAIHPPDHTMVVGGRSG